VGAVLEPGFELVAEALDLDERVEAADLVVTGEGFVDEQSFEGKVVGGVVELAAGLGVPVLVVAGEVMAEVADLDAVSLVAEFGGERARVDTLACVEQAVQARLEAWG
jgi:glycerate kinase